MVIMILPNCYMQVCREVQKSEEFKRNSQNRGLHHIPMLERLANACSWVCTSCTSCTELTMPLQLPSGCHQNWDYLCTRAKFKRLMISYLANWFLTHTVWLYLRDLFSRFSRVKSRSRKLEAWNFHCPVAFAESESRFNPARLQLQTI